MQLHPESLYTLKAAIASYLGLITPKLNLLSGVSISVRELHLITEEVDLMIHDGRVEFAKSLVCRTNYPFRVSLRDFSAKSVVAAIQAQHPDDWRELTSGPGMMSKAEGKGK